MDNLNVFQMNLFAPCAPYIYVYPQRHKCLCLLSLNIFVRNLIELLGRTNFCSLKNYCRVAFKFKVYDF